MKAQLLMKLNSALNINFKLINKQAHEFDGLEATLDYTFRDNWLQIDCKIK